MLDESSYFLAALDEWRDPYFHLLGDSLNPADPSGNALLYEAHAAWMFRDLTGNNTPHPEYWNSTSILLGEAGTLFRKPPMKYHDEQTQDDYIGVASVSVVLAEPIYRHGTEYGWFFDCWSPYTGFWRALKLVATRVENYKYMDNWHGRFPGLKEHYAISAGIKPGLLGWVLWLGSIAWTSRKKGNESGWLLDYLKIRVANERYPDHWAVKEANKVYKMGLNEYYNGHISQVYAAYFGATHPFTRWAAWPAPPRERLA